jgi:hypothetical protein
LPAFMISRICQCIDEELNRDWTINGVLNATNIILREENLLFDDLAKNLENSRELYDFIYSLLIVGERKSFIIDDPIIRLGSMYGYISNNSGYAAVSNKIFEIRMTNYFISKDANVSRIENAVCSGLLRDVAKDGKFDMELAMRKFAEHYTELYSERDAEFLERHGRLIFLSYLKPLINGRGFYHMESQFTDLRRMDVIVDVGSDQFIVELKIWHGEKYKQEAYEQLIGYLSSKNAEEGYLLTFDFRKNAGRQTQAEWVSAEGKRIFDVVV